MQASCLSMKLFRNTCSVGLVVPLPMILTKWPDQPSFLCLNISWSFLRLRVRCSLLSPAFVVVLSRIYRIIVIFVIMRILQSQQIFSRFSADPQHILSRFSADSQQILSRVSADSQQILSRVSANSQQIFSIQHSHRRLRD